MGCFIIEDDYESEFRYGGDAVSSLQRITDPERVLYVGTFSKIFFPALRLGYLVLPKSLLPGFSGLKSMSDRYSPVVSQLAMARFIAEGNLDRHVARIKRLYRRRRDTLIAALRNPSAIASPSWDAKQACISRPPSPSSPSRPRSSLRSARRAWAYTPSTSFPFKKAAISTR